MTKQMTTTPADTQKGEIGQLFGKVLKWAVLGLLLFTCFMAAARKFGWL